ncbi:unnamed protein product [Prorocentrum cordatum]|uniref:Uncharacterized protein n=1 Tax=Prorocentrum cordatum TaxID=2364126 RepID=A0ABN9RX60_9DINO|nr:unnamed protein product [Polarella glacialis]
MRPPGSWWQPPTRPQLVLGRPWAWRRGAAPAGGFARGRRARPRGPGAARGGGGGRRGARRGAPLLGEGPARLRGARAPPGRGGVAVGCRALGLLLGRRRCRGGGCRAPAARGGMAGGGDGLGRRSAPRTGVRRGHRGGCWQRASAAGARRGAAADARRCRRARAGPVQRPRAGRRSGSAQLSSWHGSVDVHPPTGAQPQTWREAEEASLPAPEEGLEVAAGAVKAPGVPGAVTSQTSQGSRSFGHSNTHSECGVSEGSHTALQASAGQLSGEVLDAAGEEPTAEEASTQASSAREELLDALKSGSAPLIEEHCCRAEARGVSSATVLHCRSAACRILAEANNELREAIRAGLPLQIERAVQRAEVAGVEEAVLLKCAAEARRLLQVAEDSLADAVRGGNAALIDEACAAAAAMGVPDVVVEAARNDARRLLERAAAEVKRAMGGPSAVRLEEACRRAERAGVDATLVERGRVAVRQMRASAELELLEARRTGDAVGIDAACAKAEAAGVATATVARGRAEARALRREAELQLSHASWSSDPQVLLDACRRAEAMGVDAELVSHARSDLSALAARACAELREATRSGAAAAVIEEACRRAELAGADAATVSQGRAEAARRKASEEAPAAAAEPQRQESPLRRRLRSCGPAIASPRAAAAALAGSAARAAGEAARRAAPCRGPSPLRRALSAALRPPVCHAEGCVAPRAGPALCMGSWAASLLAPRSCLNSSAATGDWSLWSELLRPPSAAPPQLRGPARPAVREVSGLGSAGLNRQRLRTQEHGMLKLPSWSLVALHAPSRAAARDRALGRKGVLVALASLSLKAVLAMGCSSSRGRRTRSVGIPEQTSAQLDTIAQSAETGLEALAASARQTSEATAKGARHLTQAMAQHVHVEQAAHIGAQAAEAGVDVAAEREAPASPRPHLPDLESDERGRNVPDAALANWGLLGGAELEPPLASKAVLLLDAGWLAEQGGSTRVKKSDAWAQRSMRLGPRQTLPDEAFRSRSEVKSATHPSILRIACVSHCWLHPEHPDPRGINLHVLKDALKHLLREGDPKMEPWCGPGWGVLYDYCSLHQAIYQAKLTFEKKSSLMAALQKEGGAQLPADWRLATHEEVKENLAEVWRKLGQSDVCMLADNWKVDGTGKECKVMPQGNDEPPGDAIYVKDCRNQTRSPHHAEPRLGESDEERRIRLAGMTRLEPEETRLFGDALKFIGHFFSHQSTLVLMLSMSHADYIFDDSEVSSREYLERGWCACEAGLAMMVKAPSRVLDLGRVLSENDGHAERAFRRSEHEGGGNVSHRGSEWQNRCPKKWQALELPDAFRARLEKLSFSSPEITGASWRRCTGRPSIIGCRAPRPWSTRAWAGTAPAGRLRPRPWPGWPSLGAPRTSPPSPSAATGWATRVPRPSPWRWARGGSSSCRS